MKQVPHNAYFSMEVALTSAIPNYAGGLGVLTADLLLSAADMNRPLVGVSLIYHLNDNPDYGFNPARYMTLRDEVVTVRIENRDVIVRIWEKDIYTSQNKSVPAIFLSTYDRRNEPWDRDLTKHLYSPDRYTRLAQEAILGIGGVRALEALGYNISNYHLNEGHTALATLELLQRNHYDPTRVRRVCTFTTHTPIPAGHDHFEYQLAHQVLGDMLPDTIREFAGEHDLNMTQLAISLSRSVNSVSRRHREVCRTMFPHVNVRNVTNGIYHNRWVGEEVRAVLDCALPGWESDPTLLADAPERIAGSELFEAHVRQERSLVKWINAHRNFFQYNNVSPGDLLDTDTLTIGFARRFVPYKRPDLIFKNLSRLAHIGAGKIQLIYANRCHTDDSFCNNVRQAINASADTLRGKIKVVIIPDYDLRIAKKLVAGCDIWLNTPIPPREASGTSGMKAALNGGLNLSVRDGWWIEGLETEPLAGWSFGGDPREAEQNADVEELLDALEDAVDCYYRRRDEWIARMKHAVALIGYFNTHRVLNEYETRIWRVDQSATS